MRNRGELIFGGILVLLGLILLVGTIFHIDVWALCWPTFLILLGVFLVFRPRLGGIGPDANADILLIGDRRRRGDWVVKNEELWLGVGDVELDFTQAAIPAGETTLRFISFVGDVDLFVPRNVGVSIRAAGFVVDADLFGHDYDTFLTPVEVSSEGYSTAESRLRIEMTSFVADLKVKHV
jgi:lia operon protein LiaF